MAGVINANSNLSSSSYSHSGNYAWGGSTTYVGGNGSSSSSHNPRWSNWDNVSSTTGKFTLDFDKKTLSLEYKDVVYSMSVPVTPGVTKYYVHCNIYNSNAK